MAAATMLVGNIAALVQDDLKRMLAYSSIAHAGYLLMALSSVATAGAEQNTALGSLGFYLLAYTFMNAGAFAVLSLMTDADGNDTTDISSLAGLGKSNPAMALGLTICLLSLAGIPPTMGFIGKFYLFSAAVTAGQVGLAIVGAIGAAAGVYYYLRPMLFMYMREGHPHLANDGRARIALGVSAVALIVLGMMPSSVLAWAEASMRSVLG
jgi:NADH-quinone oxidoreductase subunit N